MMMEWLRVLKPGGRLIVELPSMEKVFHYIRQCTDQKMPLAPFMSWFPLWGDPKYKDPAMVHKWGYTYPTLKTILEDAGFVSITVSKARYHFPTRDMRLTAIKPS